MVNVYTSIAGGSVAYRRVRFSDPHCHDGWTHGSFRSHPNCCKFFLLTRNLYLFLGCGALGLHAFAAHARVLWHGMRLLCCALAGHCWTDWRADKIVDDLLLDVDIIRWKDFMLSLSHSRVRSSLSNELWIFTSIFLHCNLYWWWRNLHGNKLLKWMYRLLSAFASDSWWFPWFTLLVWFVFSQFVQGTNPPN